MDRIRVTGGKPLNGTISISGAKNAALPLMIAALLTDDILTLTNMPELADVTLLSRILGNHGINVTVAGKRAGETPNAGRTYRIDARQIVDTTAPYELVSRMRASFWVLGPLLARCGQARVSLPGGCAIGTRPVDLHLAALRALGADIDIDRGYVVARCQGRLRGADIVFDKASVGATHNILMAASLAEGHTSIKNAAREPEVVALATCLNAMGAQIEGIGTEELSITGVERLNGARFEVPSDRIEAGTYAMAAAMCGGDVYLEGARADFLNATFDVLRDAGVTIETSNAGVRISRENRMLRPVNISTAPYPGFPTDLQAQLMALMTRADGVSTIEEKIFENRFMHVQELVRLGADIQLDGETAVVRGVSQLTGAQVMATDLRASVSLVIAGLMAEGETIINRVYHLDRGFERIEAKLSACGADIQRIHS